MKVGYCVPLLPVLASYRLRVALPSPHLGMPYVLGDAADVTFFYKQGDHNRAQRLDCPVVFDVVNDHFTGSHSTHYRGMCAVADVVTCASPGMAGIVREHTGRDAVVIDDPYEDEEEEVRCDGSRVLWFGHSANIKSLAPYTDTAGLVVCCNIPGVIPWTRSNERQCLREAAVVLLTGSNVGASSNRVVKALRAGRLVVTPGGIPAWDEFAEWIWVGDVREGIEWALDNREEACRKVKQGQAWIRERYSPASLGKRWGSLFASTLDQATR